LVLEIFVLYLPILLHAVIGVYFVFVIKSNTTRCGIFNNCMFLLQIFTGIVTLIFIAFHVWHTRVQVYLSVAEVNYQMMEEILVNPLWFTFYAIGVLSTIFHFANGLWSFFVTWGIAQSPKAQRIATYVSIAV